MKGINPSEVLYIKLGLGGEYEKDCITNGTLQIDFHEFPHELYMSCLKSGNWDEVQKAYRNTGKSAGAATNYTHQIQRFYEADENVLWVTFYKGALYWCFAKSGVKELNKICKSRGTISGWSSENINGQQLLMSKLSGKVLAMQGFRGTICTVKEHDYLVDKINGNEPKNVAEAFTALLELQKRVEDIVRSLTWQDFEILIDLIFRQAGWQRDSELGGTIKTLDMDLISPITKERFGVQVKAAASLSDFEKYKTELMKDMKGFTRFYFAVHTPDAKLLTAPKDEDDNVELLLPADISSLAVQYGLTQWVIDKAR